MASVIEKVKTLLSASFNDMIDQALKRDPIKTLNEYLRQHEQALPGRLGGAFVWGCTPLSFPDAFRMSSSIRESARSATWMQTSSGVSRQP